MQGMTGFEILKEHLWQFAPFAIVELLIVIIVGISLVRLIDKNNENALLQKYGKAEEEGKKVRRKKRKAAMVLIIVALMLPVLALEYIILYGY